MFRASFLCFILLLAPIDGYTEPDPGEFYERDFAKQVPGAAASSLQGKSEKSSGGTYSRKDIGQVRNQSIDPATRALLEKLYIPPSFFLFVNSKDEAHLNSVLQKALTLAESGRIGLSAVYHIGDYRTISPQNKERLTKSFVHYLAVPSVFFDETVRLSPTWVLFNEAGFRIVEGTLNIERFIGPQGQYEAPRQPALDKSKPVGDLAPLTDEIPTTAGQG